MKIKIIFLAIFISAYCFGQENKVYKIIMTTPGKILNYINYNALEEVTELTISGVINKTDIDAIKRMSNLKLLNITNTTIQYNKEALNKEIANYNFGYQIAINMYADSWNQLSTQKKQKIKNKLNLEIANVTKLYKSGGMLDDGLFKDFFSLESLYLPKTIQVIGDRAFSNCTGLHKIILPANLTSIGVEAFKNCSNLIVINLPAKISKIGSRAFQNCSKLEKVVLPSYLKTIESKLFYACDNLNEITVFGVNEIYSSFICGCKSLKIINCLAKTPPKYNNYEEYDDNCPSRNDIIFYFPKESVTAYVGSIWADTFTIKTK